VGIIYLDLDKFYLRKIRRSYLSAFNSVGCICCLVKKERRRERERERERVGRDEKKNTKQNSDDCFVL
jgi:hypothetical protein